MESIENKPKIKHWRETIQEKSKAFFLLRARDFIDRNKKDYWVVVYNNMITILVVIGAK